MQIQERLTAFAMLGAGWVLWLLVILSVICLAIVLERVYFLMTSRGNIDELKSQLIQWLSRNEVDAAKTELTKSKTFEAKIVQAGLDAVSDGADSAEQKMAGQSIAAKLQMEKNLAFLGTVGNNAPFVGLLGTVIGIIRSFHELDQSGGQVNARLMSEIGEALVATAIGILVALPAVAFYNIFQRVIKARLARGEALGKELLAHLQSVKSS